MNNYSPHHYCSVCNADSLYAPQPNGSFPKIHSYLCGSTQLYLESGTQVFTGHGQQVTTYSDYSACQNSGSLPLKCQAAEVCSDTKDGSEIYDRN